MASPYKIFIVSNLMHRDSTDVLTMHWVIASLLLHI